jgi:hypothetical protein
MVRQVVLLAGCVCAVFGRAHACEARRIDDVTPMIQGSLMKIHELVERQTMGSCDIFCTFDIDSSKLVMKIRPQASPHCVDDFVSGVLSSWNYGLHRLDCGCYMVEDWVAAHLLKICTGRDAFASHYEATKVVDLLLERLLTLKVLMPERTLGRIDIDTLCESFVDPDDEADVNNQVSIVEMVQKYNTCVDGINQEHNHAFARTEHLTYFD